MKLSIDLPSPEQNVNQIVPGLSLTPKLLTPVANFLHFNDELKNQSPTFFKESSNPFAETFKQAASNPFAKRQANFDDSYAENNHESLNTPSIDLKSFEPKLGRPQQTSSKLDLLISASNDQILNSFDSIMPNAIELPSITEGKLE